MSSFRGNMRLHFHTYWCVFGASVYYSSR